MLPNPHHQQCGGRRRDRRASRRGESSSAQQATLVWSAPEGPEGLAAVPVGGGRARPRCWSAAAGPGRASRSTTPSDSKACGDLAGGPPPTSTHSGQAHQGRPRDGRKSAGASGARNTRGATSNMTRPQTCGNPAPRMRDGVSPTQSGGEV